MAKKQISLNLKEETVNALAAKARYEKRTMTSMARIIIEEKIEEDKKVMDVMAEITGVDQ